MKELIEKAEKLGFKRLYTEEEQHCAYLLPIDNKTIDYLNLCLIQKWLRDEKDKNITVEQVGEEKHKREDNTFDVWLNWREVGYDFKEYEEALQQGILHALKELENDKSN